MNGKFYICFLRRCFMRKTFPRQEGYIESLEVDKTRAIAAWDGVRYVEICDELGLDPDVPDLYEQGMAENIMQRH